MNKKKLIILISTIITLAILVCVGIFALSGRKVPGVAEQLDMGEKYLAELEYEKALAAYKEVLQIDPKSVEAYLGMAEVYIAMGEYEEALTTLGKGYSETNDAKLTAKKSEVEALMAGAQATPEPTEEPASEQLPKDDAIDWIDPNLEAAIREITGIYDRDIMYSDVKDITELKLVSANLTNLEAIKHLTGLTDLDLECENLTTVEGIENLVNLTDLRIVSASLTTLEDINNLPNLSSLALWCDNLTTLEGIGNLPKLTFLFLRSWNLTSIEGIEQFTGLEEVDLWYCNTLETVKEMGVLTNMKIIKLGACDNLTNLEGIGNLTNLTELWLQVCANMESLKEIGNLYEQTWLYVEHCDKLSQEEISAYYSGRYASE